MVTVWLRSSRHSPVTMAAAFSESSRLSLLQAVVKLAAMAMARTVAVMRRRDESSIFVMAVECSECYTKSVRCT